MPIADRDAYLHAEHAEAARIKRENEQIELTRRRPAAEHWLRGHIRSYGLQPEHMLRTTLSKLVVLDEQGLEIKEKGKVVVDVTVGRGAQERLVRVVEGDGQSPIDNENARAYFGAWANRLRWLGHATYTYDDSAYVSGVFETLEAQMARTTAETPATVETHAPIASDDNLVAA